MNEQICHYEQTGREYHIAQKQGTRLDLSPTYRSRPLCGDGDYRSPMTRCWSQVTCPACRERHHD